MVNLGCSGKKILLNQYKYKHKRKQKHTNGHGDSMTESAQWDQFSEI